MPTGPQSALRTWGRVRRSTRPASVVSFLKQCLLPSILTAFQNAGLTALQKEGRSAVCPVRRPEDPPERLSRRPAPRVLCRRVRASQAFSAGVSGRGWVLMCISSAGPAAGPVSGPRDSGAHSLFQKQLQKASTRRGRRRRGVTLSSQRACQTRVLSNGTRSN